MSEDSKKYREAMKAKAHRLANQRDEKVDASDYHGDAFDATAKRQPKPVDKPEYVKRLPYAAGGAVARKNGGKTPRKRADGGMGGSPQLMNPNVSGAQLGASIVPKDLLNPHNPTMGSLLVAKGGRAKKRASGGGNWIAGAIKHPGALHKELHVPEGKKIPEKKLQKAEHSKNPLERKRANLAETLKGLHKAEGGSVPGNNEVTGTRPVGGRLAKAEGGPTKWKYLQYGTPEAAVAARKEHFSSGSANPARLMPNGKIAYRGSFAGSPPVSSTSDRVPKAKGGSAKGKTTVNVIIAQKPSGPDMPQAVPPMPMPPPRPPMGPPPGAAIGTPGAGMSPVTPPGGPNIPPPSMRAAGGRTDYPIEDGAGGGKGRLEKIKAYGRT